MLITLLMQQPGMIWVIVQRTPYWVRVMLVALLALGISQLRSSKRPSVRAIGVPLVFTALAGAGVVSAFLSSPALLSALAVWFLVALATAALATKLRPDRQRGTLYLPGERKFEIPGSAWPLILIMGIFLTKYYVNLQIAMQPALTSDSAFVVAVAGVYGLLSGVLSANTVRLWRLTRESRSFASAL